MTSLELPEEPSSSRAPLIDVENDKPPHPNTFEKDTKMYMDAVQNFFALSIDSPAIRIGSHDPEDPYSIWLRSYSSFPPASSSRETYKTLDRFGERRNTWSEMRYPLKENQRRERDILANYIEPPTASTGNECAPITLSELRRTYKCVCKAVAEIELSASTLRTNSRALVLAKKLVAESATDIFDSLRDMRPRPRPKIPTGVAKRMGKWARTMRKEWEGDVKQAQWLKERLIMQYDPSMRWRRERAREWERVRVKTLEKANAVAWERYQNEKKTTERVKVWKNAREDARFEVEMMREVKEESVSDLTGLREQWERAWGQSWRLDWKRDWERAWAQAQNEADTTNTKTRLHRSAEMRFVSLFDLEPLWDGGWLKRTRDEREWMERDHEEYTDEWTEEEWLLLRFWWSDVDKWAERRKDRMMAIYDFGETCTELISELRKIDGSSTADDLDIFHCDEEAQEKDLIETCVFHLEFEMVLGDEDRFIRRCNAIFASIERQLRSKALEQGLDTLIKKQDHFRNSFMDFATVAIFFSSITATTLQFSFPAADQSVSSTIVNLCWFASLVLSIASATNSFLGAIVHQSPEYLRPSANFDFRFLQAWFKFIPPMLLSISGLLFLIGICVFTFLSTASFSDQGTVIKHITVVLTSTNVLALVIMILLAFTGIFQRIASTIIWVIRMVKAIVQIVIYIRQLVFPMYDSWLDVLLFLVMDTLLPTISWVNQGLGKFTGSARGIARKFRLLFNDLWMKFNEAVGRRSLSRAPAP